MLLGELEMRVQSLSYLNDRHVRRLMMATVGRTLARIDAVDSGYVYARLRKLARGPEENVAVGFALMFGLNSPARRLVKLFFPVLPWYVRMLVAGRSRLPLS